MSDKLDMFTPALIAGMLLLSSLITGKALNPLRGMRPFIVSRSQEPRRYWASVAMNAIFLTVAAAIASTIFLN